MISKKQPYPFLRQNDAGEEAGLFFCIKKVSYVSCRFRRRALR